MSREKKTMPDQLGNEITGELVEVVESTDRFSDITLEDGTKIRLKPVVTEVIRGDKQWDPDGNPIYVVRSTTVVTVSNVKDSLKQKM